METMQPTLKNGRNVWDSVNMPAVEFQERIRTINEWMREQDVDVLLAYGYAYDHYGNAAYLSNFIPDLTRGALVAVTEGGGVTLFFEGSPRGLPSAKTTTWVEDVRACPDISREAARYLEEASLVPSTIGLAGVHEWMPQHQFGFLLDFLQGCSLVDANPLLRDMRRIKSWRERDQVRRSSRIVKKAFDFLTGTAIPSLNEKSLEASMFREARLEGAEDVRVLFGKPRETPWALCPSQHVSLGVGQTVIVYVAVEFERYWSAAIRTVVAGENAFSVPEPGSVQALYRRAVGLLSPGKTVSRCYEDIIDSVEKSRREQITDYGLGQGVGLGPQEPPRITSEDTSILEEGMCMTLRLAIKDQELGAIMMGDTVCLTKQGIEVLTR